MNGWAAAIMRMWLSTDRKRLPMRPQGLAQSNTGRCSALRCGAPSSVMAPQTWVLAASMSALEKPMWASSSKDGSLIWASLTPSFFISSSPSVQRLNTNLMSKALLRLPFTLSMAASDMPLALSEPGLTAGA